MLKPADGWIGKWESFYDTTVNVNSETKDTLVNHYYLPSFSEIVTEFFSLNKPAVDSQNMTAFDMTNKATSHF